MDKAWLESQLAAGHSIESIASEVSKDPSTVYYWLKKHGLRAPHAHRFAPRGPIPRDRLAQLVGAGMTIAELASELGRGQSSVRHWLARYGLATDGQRAAALGTMRTAPDMTRRCRRHGMTRYVRNRNGHYRCATCRQERVADRRRAIKRILVEEAGGACALCGYDRYAGALQFHHVDPSAKTFALSLRGAARAIDKAREEARKCVLLCATCHAEVEGGVSVLPMPT